MLVLEPQTRLPGGGTIAMKPAKRLAQNVMRGLLRLCPNRVLFRIVLPVVRRLPEKPSYGMLRLFPPHRRTVLNDYLGDLRVNINTVYPIERLVLPGRYEPDTEAMVMRFVRPGHVCVDAGANIGAITMALAKQSSPGGRVFAFEPGPGVFLRLTDNLALNPDLRCVVTSENVGLSDKEGVLRWKEDEGHPGNAGFCGVGEHEGQAVRVTTLDHYFESARLARLDFVKIDVEGMELEVIRGAMGILARHRPVLCFETFAEFEGLRGMPLFAPIEGLLRSLDYLLYRVEPGGHIVETRAPNFTINTLAVPRGHETT